MSLTVPTLSVRANKGLSTQVLSKNKNRTRVGLEMGQRVVASQWSITFVCLAEISMVELSACTSQRMDISRMAEQRAVGI